MKYKAILQLLKGLIYIKRFFWWLGSKLYQGLDKTLGVLGRKLIYIKYKVRFFLKKNGLSRGGMWLWGRGFLQMVVGGTLFLLCLPQSNLYAKKEFGFPGQKTVAYTVSGGEQEVYNEESATDALYSGPTTYSWREKSLSADTSFGSENSKIISLNGAVFLVAGGLAVQKPIILPGSTLLAVKRFEVDQYVVETGDSLGTIAQDFGVSIATVLWENNLTIKSVLRPGDILRIPPVTGVMHMVKKGDNLKKIALLYEAKPENIASFNAIKSDGSNLKVGVRIMVPDGIRPEQKAVAAIKRTDIRVARGIASPPSSVESPGGKGFIWPSGSHIITQYFGFKHPALDIAGPFQTPSYAAKAGVVQKASCGWNSGYGCYVVIDHGGGVTSLYGHHSKLLVSPGDYVKQGQVIALMGNTGRVYGVTGIHLHFEIRVNGVRVNPLGYVR